MSQTPSKRFLTHTDNNENLLLEKIIRDVEVLTKDIKDFIANTSTNVAVVKTELKNLGDNVKLLSGIVKDGHDNGDLALTSKILLIQKSIEELKESILAIKQERDKIKSEEISTRISESNARTSLNIESTRGRWGLIVAVVAIVGTIAQAILGHIFK